MASTNDLIPAAAVSAAVLDLAQTRDPADVARASYRRIWAGMSNGTLPAERIGGRLFIRRSDLPAITATLGLKVPATAKRAQRTPSNAAAA